MPVSAAAAAPHPLPPLPSGMPEGWVAREPTADDAPATYRLVADCDTAVLGHPDVALGDVVADLALDPHWQTVVVAAEGDGAVRAWAWMLDKAAGRTLADVYVDPALPAHVGDSLAAWCWQVVRSRAARMASLRDVPATTIEVGSLEGDVATGRRLAVTGFERVRTFWRMRRPLMPGDAHPEAVPGVTVRSVADSDLRTVHEIVEAAFADHWGHDRRDFEDWWARASTRFGFDLDLWWMADLDGTPAGVLIGTSQMAEDDAIFVSWLGTLPAARGRGVAKSLLRKAFAAGLQHGWSEAQLGVDSDNATSAPQLYAAVGMTVAFAMHAWRLEVDAVTP